MYDEVAAMIAKQFRVDVSAINENSRLVEDLKADSANVMVLIMDLEEQFGMMVEDDALMTLKTVGDVAKYVEAHKQ